MKKKYAIFKSNVKCDNGSIIKSWMFDAGNEIIVIEITVVE